MNALKFKVFTFYAMKTLGQKKTFKAIWDQLKMF